MWTREQLKRNGKFAFQRNYWPCVGVTFIMMVVSAVFSVGSSWGNRRYSISATNYYNSGHHLYSHSYTRYFPRVGVAMGIVILLVALLCRAASDIYRESSGSRRQAFLYIE